MSKKYEIDPLELRAAVALYQATNPFMTHRRIYARWRSGKLRLLQDYKVWPQDEYMRLFEERVKC